MVRELFQDQLKIDYCLCFFHGSSKRLSIDGQNDSFSCLFGYDGIAHVPTLCTNVL